MELFGLSVLMWGDPGQQVSHHLVTCSLPSEREEDQKDRSVEKTLTGQDEVSLVGKREGGAGQGREKETGIAKPGIYREHTNAQPVPEQCLLWKNFPLTPVLMLITVLCSMENTSGHLESAV